MAGHTVRALCVVSAEPARKGEPCSRRVQEGEAHRVSLAEQGPASPGSSQHGPPRHATTREPWREVETTMAELEVARLPSSLG